MELGYLKKGDLVVITAGVPLGMSGTTNLLEVKDAVSTHTDIDWVSCAVGFVVAAFVGLCAIKLVNWLVKTDKFKVFAYYTLVLGVIVLVISFIEMCMGHPISFAK